MADEEYHSKLRDLQKYVPFLENTIKRLKTETGKPREAQISKLQSLLVILTNTKKKLKYDALKKCEEVILKLYEKVEKKPTMDTPIKHTPRNSSDNKFLFVCTTPPDDEAAFSVARQKLNKQTELTPASPSPPLETAAEIKNPVVIPTEKIGAEKSRGANNEFSSEQPPFQNNFVGEVWTSYQNNAPSNQPQIWHKNPPGHPMNNFPLTPPLIPPFFHPPNHGWSPVDSEPLYLRRNDLNRPTHDPKYDVWKNMNFPKSRNNQNSREIVDYSDSLGIDNCPKLEDKDPPKPVPAPVIVEPPKKEEPPVKVSITELAKNDPIIINYAPKPEVKPIAPPITTSLNKPPLSESDLQDLLSSSASPNSGEASPLVSEDMDLDKLEELKEKLCKELEESKKKEDSKKPVVQPPKPKSPRVIERVVKEQDNIFGSLLSSIDEQIMVKNKEHHKKPDKKDSSGKKEETKRDSKHSSSSSSKHDKARDKDRNKSKERSKDKTITKSEVSKLNEKVKSSYIKDDSKSKSKEESSKHHKRDDKDSSKHKKSDHTKRDSKSKSKPDKDIPKDKDKPKDKEKPKEKDKPIKEPEEPKKEMQIVDQIMKDLKESVKEKKEETLSKFGDSVREMQEMLKCDSNHSVASDSSKDSKQSDEKTSVSGRLSDKYPHKRKPSIEKLDPPKQPDPPKVVEPFVPPKSKPESPVKLADPRLLRHLNISSPPLQQTPQFPSFTPPIPQNSFPSQVYQNDHQMDAYGPNMGSQTPMDPFLNEPFPNMGNMTPQDPFSTSYDIDMRDPAQTMQFANNFGNPDQFWNRPNQEPFNQRYQNFTGPMFPQNQSGPQQRHCFPNSYSQYDLSQMTPIDFYDTEAKNQDRPQTSMELEYNQQNNREFNSHGQNNRPFRGRGTVATARGAFRGRGQCRNIQWVNPMVREESKNEDFSRKSISGRHSLDNRFANSRFSTEDRQREDSVKSDPRTARPTSRFSEEPKEDYARKYDPRKHSSVSSKDSKPSKESRDPRESKDLKESIPKKKEEVFSPLDSLYSSQTKQQIGKGYGIQNFKIPKIRRSVEETKETKEEKEVKKEVEPVIEEPSKEPEPELEKKEEKPIEEPAKIEETIKEEEVKKSEEVKKPEEVKKLEEVKKPEEVEVKNEANTSSTSKEESSGETNTKTDSDEKLVMFNKLMEHMLNSWNPSSLLECLEKWGCSLPQAKTRRIRRIIESDSETENEEVKEKVQEPLEKVPEVPEPETPPENPVKEEEEEEVQGVEGDVEDDVVESVGERIKNRRRKKISYSSDSSPVEKSPPKVEKKTKTKRKNALELLQDDLREMFISEGVLTASGKRMCRMMKEHQESGLYSEVSPKKKDPVVSSSSEDDDTPLARRKLFKKPLKPEDPPLKKLPLRKTRTSPRVLLEKIDIPPNKSSSESSEDEIEKPSPDKQKRTRRGRKPQVVEPEPVVEPPESPEKKKPLGKKKKKNWAHGVIKKGKKGKPDKSVPSPSVSIEISDNLSVTESLVEELDEEEPDIEENALLKIDTKPDVNYFLDNSKTFDCKLCQYKGKLIVPHYRTRHRDSENMISRLSPDQAETAKIESTLNKFDAIEAFDEYVRGKKRRTSYNCRFCTLTFKQEFTSSFFDHICTHTGEYRYSCEMCTFYTGVRKTLSTHCHNTHPDMKRPVNIVPLFPAPPNFRIVFGYICKTCNFTQLLKENLEKHIKLSHPGDNIEIIKISMSSKPVNLDDLQTVEPKVVETPVEIVKEPDMAAFLEPVDYSLREQIIQDERRKKMEEIASNITPRRSTFFVDQLKNKLQNVMSSLDIYSEDIPEKIEPPESPEPPETIEPLETIEPPPLIEEAISDELSIKIASTCSLADFDSSFEQESEEIQKTIEDSDELELHISEEEIEEPMDISNVELSNSKQKGMLNTIQRLQAKLQSPTTNAAPETIETTEIGTIKTIETVETTTTTINVGAIEVEITDEEQRYICRVENCTFTSLYKISFRKHCAEAHPKLLVTCDLCPTKPLTMSGLFIHIIDKHKQQNITPTSEPLERETVGPGKIRLRRISDLLSKPAQFDSSVEPLLEALNQPIIFEPLEPKTAPKVEPPVVEPPVVETLVVEPPVVNPPVVNPPVVKPPQLGFIQIKDVRTLTPEEEHNLQPSLPSNVTFTTATGKKILQTKKILVPVKEIPKYLTVKKSGGLCYINKKSLIAENEVLSCSKSNIIFKEMLRFPKIIDLYKCPIDLCSYSTNVKIEFAEHFNNHKWCQIICCVYCCEGISSDKIIPHIDKFHQHCVVQCGFCFYRAISKNYLLIHQQNAHGFSYESLTPNVHNKTPKYYALNPPKDMFPLYKYNPSVANCRQKMIPPYECRTNACMAKFLLPDDFMVHLHVTHKQYFVCAVCEGKNVGFVTAQALITHYLTHSIGRYQCRFCLFGASVPSAMYAHYARKHPNMRPIAYYRQFKNPNRPLNNCEDIMEIDIETKLYIDKLEPTSESVSPPDLIPISSLSPSATVVDPAPSPKPPAVTDDIKPSVTNLPVEKVPNSDKILDIIDLSEEQNKTLTNEDLNEPLVTLKHRSVESKNAVENAVDPLSVELDFQNVNIDTLNFSELIPNAPSEAVPTVDDEKSLGSIDCDSSEEDDPKVTELKPIDLFRCANINCRFKTQKISDFKLHLFTCDILGENLGYICVHCKKNFNTVTELCEHIVVHGIRRFSCDLCSYMSALSRLIVKHMKKKHKIVYTKFEPIETGKKDMTKDMFVVQPIRNSSKNISPPESLLSTPKKTAIFDLTSPISTPISSPNPDTAQTSPQKLISNIFGPEDIDLLPRPPVYSSDIRCKLCSYNTKVRSNMQRHLQQHIDEKAVPETAPINPVPCLEKNEKMFDKMTNLAASSHSGRMGGKAAEKQDKNAKVEGKSYPGFVPSNKRFVCGAKNCNYLTHGDSMLRHHLTALHADETSYKCPHCLVDFPSSDDGLEIDQILFHIKMHDLHLFKCPNCDFIHYQKHKMDRHIADNHPEMGKHFQVIRELDNSANQDDSRPSLPTSLIEPASVAEPSNEHKPWRCGFCSYKTTSRVDIQNHTSSIHNIKSQFKCGLCSFRCSAKYNYNHHFKTKHPNMEINMISVYFKITEDEEPRTSSQEDFQEPPSFDTTPLWSKNKSGVKHIRGILLEESRSVTKRTPKIIEKLAEIKTTLGAGTSKSVDDITKNLFGELKEDQKVTKDPQKAPDLAPKYPSNFGTPEDNLYVCPTCNTFKTKSVKDFIAHLHAEMNYYRCACQQCNSRFMDMSQAKVHWAEHHKSISKEEKITPLTPDGKVENWVDNCIRHQYTNMRKSEDALDSSTDTVILEKPDELPETPEPEAVKSPEKLQCEHCLFIAKTVQTFRKHMKRHTTFRPYKCNHCSYDTITFAGISQHHWAKHNDLELSYIELEPPSDQIIRPLKRKRAQNEPSPTKAPIQEDIVKPETVSPTVDSKKSPEPKKPKVVLTEAPESNFDVIYVCFHCPRKNEDLEVIRRHFLDSHDKVAKDIFKYKKVTIDTNKKVQYKCSYCTWFGHPEGLKQHHLDNHSDKTWVCEKAIRYKCTSCQKIFPKIPKLKKHFIDVHSSKNLSYQTVLEDNLKESLDTTEVIEEPIDLKPEVGSVKTKCDYCSDSFDSSEQLLSHHKLLHSHLELKTSKSSKNDLEDPKKYKCPQCGHTSNSYPAMRDHLRAHHKPFCCAHCHNSFSYPNLLKSHHLKEHRILPLGEIKEQPEMKKLVDKLRENMLYLAPDGTYVPKSELTFKRAAPEHSDTPPAKIPAVEVPQKINVARKSTTLPAFPKNVAKKSTSNKPSKPEGYSFYGTKPCDITDYKNVMSEINIMGKSMPINVVAMSHVLNLFPKVVITDCKKTNL